MFIVGGFVAAADAVKVVFASNVVVCFLLLLLLTRFCLLSARGLLIDWRLMSLSLSLLSRASLSFRLSLSACWCVCVCACGVRVCLSVFRSMLADIAFVGANAALDIVVRAGASLHARLNS